MSNVNPSILVIDDLRSFIDGRIASYARTCVEGLEAIQGDTSWDEVWFDHDLGYNPDTGQKDTTRPIAMYLEARYYGDRPLPIGKVYIHTANFVGERWLEKALSKIYDVQVVRASEFNLYQDESLL